MTPDPRDVDEAVFDVVERIPPGRVSSYGAIGELVGVGPRRVARALAQDGGAEIIPAAATASEEEARAHAILRLLMDCPIPDILVRTLGFLYS